jgi:16S rRNA (guanine527-N7)-methyltransferase
MQKNLWIPEVSRETQKKFAEYFTHLQRWNHSTQLVQQKTLSEFKNRHLDDCLQISPLINTDTIVDLGSGAGLPGLILSMIFEEKEFTLIESNHKKHNFHLEIIHRLNLKNVVSICDRIENIATPFPLVISRALAPLINLFELGQNVSCETTSYVFLKGDLIEDEIAEALKKWTFDYQLLNSLTSKSGRIIVVHNLKKRHP